MPSDFAQIADWDDATVAVVAMHVERCREDDLVLKRERCRCLWFWMAISSWEQLARSWQQGLE